jgi:prolyl oligopeptidase
MHFRASRPLFRLFLLLVVLSYTWPTTPAAAEPTGGGGFERADLGWLEAMDSPEVLEWARGRDRAARAYAAAYAGRDALEERIQDASKYRRYMAPIERGGRYFYTSFDPGLAKVSLHMRVGLNGAETTLIDGERLARNKGKVLFRQVSPSPDGKLVAYAVRKPASRWSTLRVRDVDSGRDLPDRIDGLAGSLSSVWWTADSRGFYYDRYELPPEAVRATAPLRGEAVAFHELGTPAGTDGIVYEPEDPDNHFITLRGSTDERFLGIIVRDGRSISNRLLILDIAKSSPKPVALAPEADSRVAFVGSSGSTAFLLTDRRAPRFRIVAVDMEDPDLRWRELIPERAGTIDTWVAVRVVGDRLIVGYREDGVYVPRVFHKDGTPLYKIELPEAGSVWSGFVGHHGSSEAFYVVSGFADPGTVFRLDLESGRSSVFRRPELPWDPREIETWVVYYSGPGGSRIPMYLTHHRDLAPTGSEPVMIYGYGFGAWASGPWFRAHMWEFFKMGGIFALPALRGGGEFGEEWHRAGVGVHRQNGIDDFIAAAEWLIAQGLASPETLVAETQSAGASLVGAALVQRPDLFGAGIFGFPLLDLMSYERYTSGARWRGELGSVENPEERRALLAYSPVHNVRSDVCYPPILILPGEDDETTPPMHGYKFAAALEGVEDCANPALLRVAWGAGHSYGLTPEDKAASFADQLAFMARSVGLGAPSFGEHRARR